MAYRIIKQPVPQPPVGTDWSYVPSSSDYVKLLTVTATLTTTAAVGTRSWRFSLIGQSGDVYFQLGDQEGLTASKSLQISYARGMTAFFAQTPGASQSIAMPLPDTWLLPGDAVAMQTVSLGVGDQWSAVSLRFLATDHFREEEERADVWQYLMRGYDDWKAGRR